MQSLPVLTWFRAQCSPKRRNPSLTQSLASLVAFGAFRRRGGRAGAEAVLEPETARRPRCLRVAGCSGAPSQDMMCCAVEVMTASAEDALRAWIRLGDEWNRRD